MLSALIAVCISVASAQTIPFPNGATYTVSICADPTSSEWGIAYLTDSRMRKPISEVLTDSEVRWFRRRDGSAVVLLETYRAVLAFTITATGKVYEHERAWNSTARIEYCGSRTAVVGSCEYYSMLPSTTDVDPPPEGRICLMTKYVWSQSQMKWLAKHIGYH